MAKLVKLKGGPKKAHGGYSYLTTGRLPEHRRKVERYLTGVRQGLIRDLGPTEENLSTAQIVLIDRVVSKLGVLRCIEEYIRETSVMKGEDVAPSLKASFLAYNNSVRLDLTVLGIHKKVGDEQGGLTQAYIDEKYGDKEKK